MIPTPRAADGSVTVGREHRTVTDPNRDCNDGRGIEGGPDPSVAPGDGAGFGKSPSPGALMSRSLPRRPRQSDLALPRPTLPAGRGIRMAGLACLCWPREWSRSPGKAVQSAIGIEFAMAVGTTTRIATERRRGAIVPLVPGPTCSSSGLPALAVTLSPRISIDASRPSRREATGSMSRVRGPGRVAVSCVGHLLFSLADLARECRLDILTQGAGSVPWKKSTDLILRSLAQSPDPLPQNLWLGP
jgi:hypothetical protein